MSPMLRAIVGALALGAAAFAQPAFEVASLKPSPPSKVSNPMADQMLAKAMDRTWDSRPLGWLQIQKTRLTVKNRSLAGLIASAYRVRQRQVSGPAWMANDRYEVEATFPADTPHAAVNDMLRAMLEERFGLKAHREEREEAGYALVQAKDGAKLIPAVTTEDPAAPMTDEDRKAQVAKMQANMAKRMEEMKKQAAANGVSGAFSMSRWNEANATLEQMADYLSSLVEKPVQDATGLQGKYAIDLQMQRFGDDTEEYAIAQALARLGLKLEARKVTVPVIVVDQVERTPKPN